MKKTTAQLLQELETLSTIDYNQDENFVYDVTQGRLVESVFVAMELVGLSFEELRKDLNVSKKYLRKVLYYGGDFTIKEYARILSTINKRKNNG